jgi:hypothetical protein
MALPIKEVVTMSALLRACLPCVLSVILAATLAASADEPELRGPNADPGSGLPPLVLPYIELLSAPGVVASATLAAPAGDSELMGPDPARPGIQLPGAPGALAPMKISDRSQPAALMAIAVWLSSELGLPSIEEPPAVSFVPARRMAGLRFRDVAADRWNSSPNFASPDNVGKQPTVIAIYDDEARTIFLPEGWTGGTPAELSVLVHELVHHVQTVAGLKFACAEEREKAAFEAQERWLALFGSDLLKEFELDPFTLLVRTNCLY